MLTQERFQRLGLADIRERVLAGKRLSREDGERLFACPDPTAVGALAHARRTAMHGDAAYYVANQHINYTNVCVNGCKFCAYQRAEGEPGGFTLDLDAMLAKIEENPIKPREVHIVGGCHPKLRLSYFTDLLRGLKKRLPQVTLKCFTAVEIAHFADLEGSSPEAVLAELKDAGLDMLPGGGAEIFAPDVRTQICPRKIPGDEWLRIHELAHGLGIRTNCTMLFGHLESIQDRLDHLIALRETQDRSGGFTCFIPLPFLTENSALTVENPLTGLDELRTIAICRLMLDNVPHIKAYWVMLTVKQAQTALHFGADDFDGTVVEEKIGHMAGAGTEQGLTRAELEAMIRGCGFTPVERDAFFNPVHADAAASQGAEQ